MRTLLRIYLILAGTGLFFFAWAALFGGDPSTCWHPSRRTDGPEVW